MQGTILLNHDEDTRQVEEEEKTRFLKGLLEQMGVPIEDFWNTDKPLSVNQKIKLRNTLAAYQIQVLDDLDGHLQVYVEDELIGEWNKCTYKLKKDLRQINPRKQFYLEMLVDCWSIFEESEQNAT